MKVRLLAVPYDSGVRGVRMGAGPLHLFEAGLETRLCQAGHVVRREIVEIGKADLQPEPRTALELNRALAVLVGEACAAGEFPVVLAGSCYSAIGGVAGLGAGRTGVAWFDSHADFNTPETTVSGFLDGMALAMLTGRCWRALMAGVPGFQPLAERDVCLLAARDLDREEAEQLASSEVVVLAAEQVPSRFESVLRPLSTRVDRIYAHVDLDVLDPSQGRANELAAPGGLTLAETSAALRTIGRLTRLAGLALTAYDPAFDEEGRVCRAAVTLLETALEMVAAAGDAGHRKAEGPA